MAGRELLGRQGKHRNCDQKGYKSDRKDLMIEEERNHAVHPECEQDVLLLEQGLNDALR